jgi:hypothetical protein
MQKFHKEGDLPLIFHDLMVSARRSPFLADLKQSLSATATSGYTRFPMQWMRSQEKLFAMCNNVDPELCGNLEVRGILEDTFPGELNSIHRVRRCRESWHWCDEVFGELQRNYRDSVVASCDDRTPTWDDIHNVTINRYQVSDKYDYTVNSAAVLSPTYETFLDLVLIIWWLSVVDEMRQVLAWWMTIIYIDNFGETHLKEKEGKLEVISVSTATKIFSSLVIVLPRTLIIIALSFIGTEFLIIADSYNDLILNSVALGFLIEVDDMLFGGVASQHDKSTLEKIEICTAEHDCHNCVIDCLKHNTSILLIILIAVVTYGLIFSAYYTPYGKHDLASAYACLCHAEGDSCIVAKLFGHDLKVPEIFFAGGGGLGRMGKGR